MTATPPCPDWLVFVCVRDGVLVFGNNDKLADPGVLGESKLIWLKEATVFEELAGKFSFGRSASGRGAGPGFMNWSGEYILSVVVSHRSKVPISFGLY